MPGGVTPWGSGVTFVLYTSPPRVRGVWYMGQRRSLHTCGGLWEKCVAYTLVVGFGVAYTVVVGTGLGLQNTKFVESVYSVPGAGLGSMLSKAGRPSVVVCRNPRRREEFINQGLLVLGLGGWMLCWCCC